MRVTSTAILELLPRLVLIFYSLIRFSAGQSSDYNISVIPDLYHCPKDWLLLDWTCYRYFGSRASWAAAGLVCDRLGATLVKIEDPYDNSWIASLSRTNSSSSQTSHIWIGASSSSETTLGYSAAKPLRWTDGSEIRPYFTAWAIDEPNLSNGNCASLSADPSSETWRMEFCNSQLPFVCQIPACPKGVTQCMGEAKCVAQSKICDGVSDCQSRSDEFNCPKSKSCTFKLTGLNGQFSSPNHPASYPANSNCLWFIEAPLGMKVELQLREFVTEEGKDFMTVLGGSPVESKAVSLGIFSGRASDNRLLFRSWNNHMIIKFNSDLSIERSGFLAEWTAVRDVCGGELIATDDPQALRIPMEPNSAFLECIYFIRSPSSRILSIDLLEYSKSSPDDDTSIEIRNGDTQQSSVIGSWRTSLVPQQLSFQSTTGTVFILIRSKGKPSGFSAIFRYSTSCNQELRAPSATFGSPGTELVGYPRNTACTWNIKPKAATGFTLRLHNVSLSQMDALQIYQVNSSVTKTVFDSQKPSSVAVFHISTSEALVHLLSGPVGSQSFFNASYSINCPPLTTNPAILSGNTTVVGTEVTVTCPVGFEFSSRETSVMTKCLEGGQWSVKNIPQCRPRYCGPVPLFANAEPIVVTSFVFGGDAVFKCLDGFVFRNGELKHNVSCGVDGKWTDLVECIPVQCPKLELNVPATFRLQRKVVAGNGTDFGSVVEFYCDEGYSVRGASAIHCLANGLWSDAIPKCERKVCASLPKLQNGFFLDKQSTLSFGDTITAGCLPGYKLHGPSEVSCLANQTFGDLPRCVDIDECLDTQSCDPVSTTCQNVPGDHLCKCKKGFGGPPTCQQNYLFTSEIQNVTVSGSVPEFDKSQIGIASKGWCGLASRASDNWVEVDFKYSKIITAVRILPVLGGPSMIAGVRSFTLSYLDASTGNETWITYAEPNGDDLVFPALLNSTSGTPLPQPIETRKIRVTINEYFLGPCMKMAFIGCWRQSCVDIDECQIGNGQCDQVCINEIGSYQCGCEPGYQLYRSNGTSFIYLSSHETGQRDGDLLHLNRTCVPRACQPVLAPLNGVLLTSQTVYRYKDEARFACRYGFQLVGSAALSCMENGDWNASQPLCIPASCLSFEDDPKLGMSFEPKSALVPLGRNITLRCKAPDFKLPAIASAETRKCVFDHQSPSKRYRFVGGQPSCDIVDCGLPPVLPGAFYSGLGKLAYGSSFKFTCASPFITAGESSAFDDIVRCTKYGIWDFGSLRCDGPACVDPGRPVNGRQIATSYEELSVVKFECTKPGYVLSDASPIMCQRQMDCPIIQPLGLSTGFISDSNIKATTEIPGFESSNIRLNSLTGWCALPGNATYIEIDLGRINHITSFRAAGVVSDLISGRVTQFRIFHKLELTGKYAPLDTDFSDNPSLVGSVSTIKFPKTLTARFIAVGILGFIGNPCMKLEFYGCSAETEEKATVGWNNTVPMCVDKEPPTFINCPQNRIIVKSSLNGAWEPVNYEIPFAKDNSGFIAGMDVNPVDFAPGAIVMNDMVVEYTAFDATGNNATCRVQIKVVESAPFQVSCPKSYNFTIPSGSDYTILRFNAATHPVELFGSGRNVTITYTPDMLKASPHSFATIAITAVDGNNMTASCAFQVNILPPVCSDAGLPSPANGYNECRILKDGRILCNLSCNVGYQFVEGTNTEYVCDPKSGWIGGNFVPDCVLSVGHDAVYDADITVTYSSPSAPSPGCLSQYSDMIQSQQLSIADLLSAKCSKSIDVPITVLSINSTIQLDSSAAPKVQGLFKYRISPSRFTPRLFELCGLTIDALFDFSVPQSSSSSEVSSIAKLTDPHEVCPQLEAADSKSTRGFGCRPGQVLLKNTSRLTCLDCPAGMYASGSAACLKCPSGTFQDQIGQTSCKSCPVGTFAPVQGSKNLSACLPTCGLGTYSPNGVLPCIPCPKDTYSDSALIGGVKSCTACPLNTFTLLPGAQGLDKCRAQCMPGEYSSTGLAPCLPCPKNHISLVPASKSCEECRNTFYTVEPNATTCDEVTCPLDFCSNGGKCEVSRHRAVCRCPPGFTGERCEIDVDECESQPCFNRGQCVNDRGSFHCICPAGFSGFRCEIDPPLCQSASCPNSAMCQYSPDTGHNCLCRKGFTGRFCNETMDPCMGGPCMNNGLCYRLQMERFYCECPPGFNGTHCENNIDDCADNPCVNGGTCTDLVHDFRCDCPDSFSGKFCEVKADLCGSIDCEHGFCYEDLEGAEIGGKCVCDPGWTGANCSERVDNCVGQPCKNGGNCSSTIDSFSCECEDRFTGAVCQHKVDFCEDSPCQNGATCSSGPSGFSCTCPVGLQGERCEVNVDDCAGSPCSNSTTAECVDGLDSFTCVCKSGFTGKLCEDTASFCASNSSACLNGVLCMDTVGGFQCNCPAGWKGVHCEEKMTACNPNPCQNEGQCFDVSSNNQSTFFCKCSLPYFGLRCERLNTPCFGNPCLNNGLCNATNAPDSVCDCGKDFYGPGCMFEVDRCINGLCLNGGTCQDLETGFKCSCPYGFAGDRCQLFSNPCSTSSCPPSARCVSTKDGPLCICPLNLTGDDCLKPVDTDFDFRFFDEDRSSAVLSRAPFEMGYSAFSLGFWVKFAIHGDSGTFLQLFGSRSDSAFEETSSVLMEINENAVTLLFDRTVQSSVRIPFGNVVINDGNWHHMVVSWSAKFGLWNVTVDSIKLDGGSNFNTNGSLPAFGSLLVGSKFVGNMSDAVVGRGILGRISQVRIWSRVLDFRSEIPALQSCGKTIGDGLAYLMSDLNVINGKVDLSRPSTCVTQQGITVATRISPPVCPADRFLITSEGYAGLSWTLPKSNLLTSFRTFGTNIPSGAELRSGRYSISLVRYDSDSFQDCHFTVIIRDRPCPDLEPPIGGSSNCVDFGPDNLFRKCTLQCNSMYAFAEDTPKTFVCGADGKFRPSFNSTLNRFPACAPLSAPQRVFNLRLTYLHVPCNEQTQQFITDSVRRTIVQSQLDWLTCLAAPCPGLKLNVTCQRKAKRQSNEVPRGIAVRVSFPAVMDPVRNSATKQESTVKNVYERMLFQNKAFDFGSLLPNAIPSPLDVVVQETLACQPGNVLRNGQCVACSVGTFFDGQKCVRCSQGSYQDEIGQSACKQCPSIKGRSTTTATTGCVSAMDCKPVCPVGQFYNDSASQCSPCGFGFYQSSPGRFECMRCPPRTTTLSDTASSALNCTKDCEVGFELGRDLKCSACKRGFYRGPNSGPHCLPCPKGFSTKLEGSKEVKDCNAPMCNPGSFLDKETGVCVICPFGFYQPLAEQIACLKCPEDSTTIRYGATNVSQCVSTNKCANGEIVCHSNATCLRNGDGYRCQCKVGFRGDGMDSCDDICTGYCFNMGRCSKDSYGNPFCECLATYFGDRCQSKSETAYIAGGITGAVLFIILIILLIWMICVRTRRARAPSGTPKKGEHYSVVGGTNSVYAIEYPHSVSTATVRSHAFLPHYYSPDDEWELSGYANAAYIGENGTLKGGEKNGLVNGKRGKKKETSMGGLYEVVPRQKMQMKEVSAVIPGLDEMNGHVNGDQEHSARL